MTLRWAAAGWVSVLVTFKISTEITQYQVVLRPLKSQDSCIGVAHSQTPRAITATCDWPTAATAPTV